MITQFLSSLKNLAGKFLSTQKRPHDEYSDDDEDLDPIISTPPLKKNRYSTDDVNQGIIIGKLKHSGDMDEELFPIRCKAFVSPLSGMNTCKKTREQRIAAARSHLEVAGSKSGGGVQTGAKSGYNKENSAAFQPGYLRTESDIEYLGASTNAPTPLPPQFWGQQLQRNDTEEDGGRSSISSFKFDPSITSTAERYQTADLSITKRKPIKSSRPTVTKSIRLHSGRHGVHKESESTRCTKRRSFGDIPPSCGMRRLMTPRSCIRLDDKARYGELIKQFTTCDVSNSASDKRRTVLFHAPRPKPGLSRSITSLADAASVAGAITQIHLDPVSTSKTRLKLERGEVSPTPSLSFGVSASHPGIASARNEKRHIPLIDLEADSPTRPSEEDDAIFILKEITPPKPAQNSLEDKLQLSPFYSSDWLTDTQQYYKDKASERDSDVRLFAETKKQCEHTRRECQKNLLEKVTKRISQLDIKYPERVVELSEIEEEELPELTPEIESVIQRAFKGGPAGHVLAEKFNIQITRRDIHTLAGLNWLNDEVINFYMNMLIERGKNDNYPSVYAFNTFFYSKLIKMGYGSVRRWTKKVDIFSYDLLLVPVHLGMHWCLATVDFKTKCISYYDSMLGDNHKCLAELKKYLDSEHKDKKKSSFNVTTLSTENVKDIPQQMNGSDCGMFSCKFAEYLSRNASISFTQEHMPYFRRRMVYEIVTQRLM